MRCPNDNAELVAADHHGVEMHTCPECQGVWLEQEQLASIEDQAIASQYASELDDLDDLEPVPRRARRRDKYSDGTDDFERPRNGKRRRNRREADDHLTEL